MKYLLLIIFSCCVLNAVRAQSWTTRVYTVENGMPSNNLSGITTDRKGFIWISSDNGIARFDGNTFRSYRLTEGLPDNEIVQVIRDSEGTIWALPYHKSPVYYNETTDRFEKISSDASLAGMFAAAEGKMNVLSGGGIVICTYNGVVILRKGHKAEYIRSQLHNTSQGAPQIALSLDENRFALLAHDSVRTLRNGHSIAVQRSPIPFNSRTIDVNGVLYATDTASIYKSSIDRNGAVTILQSKGLPFHSSYLTYTGRHFVLISDNGTVAALIDTNTLEALEFLPLNGTLATQMIEDAEGHVWITSAGQGLIKLSHLPVVSFNHLLPPDMAPVTVAVGGNTLLCGDNKGRIVIFKNGCIEKIINISKWSKAVSRIRNILVLKDGYYVAVEGDASLLLDNQFNIVSVYNRPYLNYTDRCATLWNDSMILAGSHQRAVRLNFKMCQAYDTIPIRTTAINADSKGRVLIGSADGFYRKDDTGLYNYGRRYKALATRVADICPTPDGLVWVGLASSFVVAIRDDDIIGLINLGNAIPGNVCNALCAGKPGELWIGTDKSLSKVTYAIRNNRISWRATSFSSVDGIPGQINDIAVRQDSLFVASTSGLYSLPVNTQPLVREIPVYITGIRIGDQDTILKDSWSLPYSMNDLDIQYSGVDLSGYMPAFQYRINNGDWQDAGGDHLALKRLSPGSYNIEIRALKRDGVPSKHVASLHVSISAPFWQSVWFWLFVFIVLTALSVTVLQRIFRRKREKQLRQIKTEKELFNARQQTFSALMNPHFIFNALNSIQHYVLAQDKRAANKYLSGFGRLIRMNFESAQKSYITLDEELERLQLYLSLEKMRFGDKLEYTMNIAPDVVPEDWQIPAMIIQPYLENALLHGIAPAKNNGHLDINVSSEANRLIVSITDNGIGMENSQQLKRQQHHVSRSMDLIRKRIDILHKLQGQVIEVNVAPANPENATYPGTRVVLSFPHQAE